MNVRNTSPNFRTGVLSRRLRGHFNYFGVSGNFRSLLLLVEAVERSWYKFPPLLPTLAHLQGPVPGPGARAAFESLDA